MAKRSDNQLAELPELDSSAIPKRFPALSSISDTDIQTMPLAALLAEAHTLKEAESRLRAVKEKLREEIHSAGYGMGVRYAGLCVITRWQTGRQSLKKELLIENGVTPAQIQASTVEGDGYWLVELPKMEGL